MLDEPGDWRVAGRQLAGGGWAFQFANDFYPDLDDTAVVAWAMHQARDSSRYAESVQRALNWLVGMQSRDGGFAAFDADNTCYYLNKIPFADHGALLGSAHQRCDRAGGDGARAHRQGRRTSPRWTRAISVPAQGARGGRLVVRPLGHQLYLRHLVGADGVGAGARRAG